MCQELKILRNRKKCGQERNEKWLSLTVSSLTPFYLTLHTGKLYVKSYFFSICNREGREKGGRRARNSPFGLSFLDSDGKTNPTNGHPQFGEAGRGRCIERAATVSKETNVCAFLPQRSLLVPHLVFVEATVSPVRGRSPLMIVYCTVCARRYRQSTVKLSGIFSQSSKICMCV